MDLKDKKVIFQNARFLTSFNEQSICLPKFYILAFLGDFGKKGEVEKNILD
jgi:hypothetical protein